MCGSTVPHLWPMGLKKIRIRKSNITLTRHARTTREDIKRNTAATTREDIKRK